MSENYIITARKNPLCPAGKRVADAVATLAPDTPLESPILISNKKVLGRAALCIDEDKPENVFAQIISVENEDGEKWDNADITALMESGKYRIEISVVDKAGNFQGKLIPEKEKKTKKNENKLMDGVLKAADSAVKKKFVKKDDMDARVSYMCENDVDPILMKRVIEGYRKYDLPAHTPGCLYRDPYLEKSRKAKRPSIVSKGLRSAVSRHAILCEGDKSVGKNVYVETLAWLLNMPLYLVTFTRQMSPASIYGDRTTDNSAMEALRKFDAKKLKAAEDADAKRDLASRHFAMMKITGTGEEQGVKIGKAANSALDAADQKALEDRAKFEKLKAQAASVNIVMEESAFCDWVEKGGVMCFNEMNMAEANFFASFTNQLLDGTGHIFVPGRGDLVINKDCVLFGTQNADYQGTEEQNEATMSRFGCIEFPQPDTIKAQLVEAVGRALEKDGFKAGTGLTRDHYKQTEDFYEHCAGAVKKSQVSNACLNIRGFVRALVEVAESGGYASLLDAIDMQVISTCPVDERAGLRSPLRTIVTL